RWALRNQPMTSASWTTSSAAASNTRPPDDAARTTTANSDVEKAASAAVSTARAEDPDGTAETGGTDGAGGTGTEVTTSWSHPPWPAPPANGRWGRPKRRGYLRSRRRNPMETLALVSLGR